MRSAITLDDYKNRFDCAKFERTDSGILQVTLHTDGGPFRWEGNAHHELSVVLKFVAADQKNRLVILTGTGEWWSGPPATWALRQVRTWATAEEWHQTIYYGRQLEMNMLDIEVPVICALNGPPWRHCELTLLCDIIIASEDSVFEDVGHLVEGNLVPGDGMHQVLSLLMGHNRARYLQLMGTAVDARQALELGLVHEVLPKAEVLKRAWAIAEQLIQKQDLLLRYTRQIFTHKLKKMMLDELGYGLALEGLAATGATYASRAKDPGRSGA